tara:strand:+ start:6579 stop:8795 length:2217 start_codon:yes stop_codon:yes gene_type:complete
MIRKSIYTIFISLALYASFVYLVAIGTLGSYEGPGKISTSEIPEEITLKRTKEQVETISNLGITNEKLILFGDLHVHTTYSSDAFLMSLPLLAGEGTHPPADACDFARFCSSLDFWSNTDHAEDLTPQDWQEIKDTVRQCNNVSGKGLQDTIAFLGWEWTQEGGFDEPHFGHKNIILKDLDDDKIPARPIASPQVGFANMPFDARVGLSALRAFDGRIQDLMTYARDGVVRPCESDLSVRELSFDCKEYARDPGELFDKLNDWGHEAIVIPHGTAWGSYTPPESDWKLQLSENYHDPNYQSLIEIYSGHGNTEPYKRWRSVLYDENGDAICPKPTENYLPGCWQAGIIIEKRCLEEGESSRECNKRAKEARKNYADAGIYGQATVSKEDPKEWLDSNQCQDCFLPAFNLRPKGSAQYILALRNFDPNDTTERFKFGFIGSSDTHSARPGNGYKDINRIDFTDAAGPTESAGFIFGFNEGEGIYGKSTSKDFKGRPPPGPIEVDRIMSYFYTGGLIATHSDERTRESIWRSIKNKEVYATSGPRILLWFDLINGNEGSLPMGSETQLEDNPRFIVRALGSFEQKPGCPDYAVSALGKERIELLCKNECYNPSNIRREIERIEVIKILPQKFENENLDNLIIDPWKVFNCDGTEECVITFSDYNFSIDKRDALYYVRAIEKESKAVNANNLRCELDQFGNCIEVNICYGSPLQTPREEDCLANTQERAWSSPIFVDYKKY